MVRCQKCAWPLFQDAAKVRLPLCATRLAEGSMFHSLRLDRSEQRYRFVVTCMLFARGITAAHREPAIRACRGVMFMCS